MKYEKCVEMVKRDRPILHRKTGTISVANLHRRKLLFASIVNVAAAKSPNPPITKRVQWASPIKTVHTIIVPSINMEIASKSFKMPATQTGSATVTNTGFYCSDCDQYYSSQSKLSRHQTTLKHQQSVSGQPSVAPSRPSNANVTKPTTLFHCSDCNQDYNSKNHFNRHQKTTKHEQNVWFNLCQNQKQG